ncbi:hypothetical protein [Mycobacterium kiyosense]|nr:hypothetical protein IWGMT90018_18610 [Mycobacterium kiyosense]
MQSHAATEQVRAAITSALSGAPRVVMVEAPNDAWYVQAVFAGLRRNVPVYVRDEEITGSAVATGQGAPPVAFFRYHRLVHPGYPFIAMLVTSGIGTVQSTGLDENLCAYYSENDTADDTAERVQQLMNRLTFAEPLTVVDERRLVPGTGVVVPLVAGRPPVVYRLNPAPGPQHGSHTLPAVPDILDSAIRR